MLMKRIFLFVGLILAVAPSLQAALGGDGSVQARAIALTRFQAEKAHLDEGQYLKVKQLNVRMLTDMQDIKTRFAADPATMDDHLAATQTRYESDLRAILRPAQLALFQKTRSSMTALNTPR